MGQNQLEKLVRSVYRETKDKWTRYSQYSEFIKKYGYWVMVGPPKYRPPVFIISSNPGASKVSMNDLSPQMLAPNIWPGKLNYLQRISLFSRKLTAVFDNVSGINIADCSAGYGLFFRSNDLETWKKKVPLDIQEEAEEFSIRKTKEILAASKPKLVLAIGKYSFDNFSEVQLSSKVRPWGSRSIELLKTGKFCDTPVLGIPHISNTRLSRLHMAEITSEITSAIKF